jgi:hypothetical protein
MLSLAVVIFLVISPNETIFLMPKIVLVYCINIIQAAKNRFTKSVNNSERLKPKFLPIPKCRQFRYWQHSYRYRYRKIEHTDTDTETKRNFLK